MKTKVKNSIKKNNGTQNYIVEINWENSRKGIICSPELKWENGVCIEVASTSEFDKGIEGIWSPEQLFVAAASGCLMTTFLAIAENSILDFTSFNCKAKGKTEMIEGKLIISEILLEPVVVITNEMQRNKAIGILKKAKDDCLIIHSIKSKITMKTAIQVKPILIESI